jgi:uncharacterized protein YkwD
MTHRSFQPISDAVAAGRGSGFGAAWRAVGRGLALAMLAGVLLAPPATQAASLTPPARVERRAAPEANLSLESGLVNAINAQREAHGLAALAVDPTLVEIARLRSDDLANRQYFSHVAPDGTTVFSILADYGIPYYFAGENLARNNAPGAASIDYAINGFMNSPSHRAIVLGAFTHVGIGATTDWNGFTYFAVVFMS